MVKDLLTALFGNGRNVIAQTAEVFRVNAEGEAQRDHDAAAAALAQFAAEFRPRPRGFDAFVDGLNRLPRPLFAFGTLALFVAAMHDPVWFSARMVGLQAVPEPLWYVLGGIVAFYFGARELHHARSLRAASPDQVAGMLDSIRQIEALDTPVAPVAGPLVFKGPDDAADPLPDNPALADMLAPAKDPQP